MFNAKLRRLLMLRTCPLPNDRHGRTLVGTTTAARTMRHLQGTASDQGASGGRLPNALAALLKVHGKDVELSAPGLDSYHRTLHRRLIENIYNRACGQTSRAS